ncbi:MAG: serine/threonine-protein kinase [Sandaracinaceae bacterium]
MDFLDSLGPGDHLGPYVIVRAIGEGGMGVVYEADHTRLQRPAAVKVLHSYLATDLGRSRFEREVRACAALSDPHTVEIYDIGESDDGRLYYAMELLEGYDLRQLVEADGPQAPGRAVRVLAQIAGALSEAHGKGLVHRDIKPPNIILCAPGGEPDVAKLVDFGLVTSAKGRGRLTIEGNLLGTPRYIAPEMTSDPAGVGPAADLYALGLVAYFLLTGQHAFDHPDRAEILRRQRDDPPPSLLTVRPSLPIDLVSVVERCLEKRAEDRFVSALALRDALLGCACAAEWNEEEARRWWANVSRPRGASERPPAMTRASTPPEPPAPT